MKTTGKLNKGLIIAIMAMTFATSSAGTRPMRHRIINSPIVVKRPVARPKVVNHFGQRDRLSMALAYIDNNRSISAKTYARITGLSKAAAEAELDAFAHDRNTRIAALVDGNKKVYVKR